MSQRPYAADLARVHDAGYGDFARRAGRGLLVVLRNARLRDGLVVDLGCGSGIFAAALLDAGYDVLGIDLSEDLLALARERAPAATFVHGSVYDAELPAGATAVTAMGEILSYAFDERAGRPALQALFRRVRAALRPGGLFMFDLVTPGREPEGGRRSFAEGDGWLLTVAAEQDATRLTRRISTFTAQDDGAWRRADEVHALWVADPADVLDDLTVAGFTGARTFTGYDPKDPLPPGWTGFVARAPER